MRSEDQFLRTGLCKFILICNHMSVYLLGLITRHFEFLFSVRLVLISIQIKNTIGPADMSSLYLFTFHPFSDSAPTNLNPRKIKTWDRLEILEQFQRIFL